MNTREGKDGLEAKNNKKLKYAMKKIYAFLLILFLVPSLVFGQENSKKKVIYFYSETCAHCIQVNEYFQDNGIYEKYEIKKIIADSPENFNYLNKFFDAFGVDPEKRGYPVVFFGTKMLVGDQPIIDNFLQDIESSEASVFPEPESLKIALEQQNKSDTRIPAAEVRSISLSILTKAAFADAINPCAFAVLILLLATIRGAKGRNYALLSGIFFSAAVFLSYFLMGLGIYKTITIFSLPKYFSIVVGSISILIGLANLKDTFWYGKIFVMEVPFSWRPKMQSLIKKVTSPVGAFGVGFLVSLFLLPCTSGPYLVVVGLLAEKENLLRTVSLLILYNLIFILPMILITIGSYFGLRLGKLDEIRKNNIKLLHAITGAIMLYIGIYLLYQWL